MLLKIYDHDPNDAGNNAYNGSLNTLAGTLTHFANIGAPAITTLTSANSNTTISYNPDGDGDAPFSLIHGSSDVDTVEALFTGKFNAPVAGVYNFDPRSDDGTNVFIDGNLIVNNNFPQGIGHPSAPRTLP